MFRFISCLLVIATASGKEEPEFCHGLACPAFETVGSANGYELRAYEPSSWASVDVQASSYHVAVTKVRL
jgi:hypothetical protein